MRIILASIIICLAPLALADPQDSLFSKVERVEARAVGVHSVYLESQIPDEGCDFDDRAVIDTRTEPGGLYMAELVKDALTFGRSIKLRVEGCVPINVTGLTAPRIILIQLRF